MKNAPADALNRNPRHHPPRHGSLTPSIADTNSPPTGERPPAHSWVTRRICPVDSFSHGGDAVPGGYNGYFSAHDRDGRQLGYIDYQVVTDPRYDDGTVLIAMVEVNFESRGQGVGMALISRLADEFPDRSFDWGYTTAEGTALGQAWEAIHADFASPTSTYATPAADGEEVTTR